VGIILLNTRFPRIHGDIGNAGTFGFPVRYSVVEDASPHRVVREKAEGLLKPFISAARGLVEEGARAITTSCGFLAIFQPEIAASVPVPVFTSSLIQLPMVHRMLQPGQKVGVITVDARFLTPAHYSGVGAEEVPVIVRGVEGEEELSRVLLDNELDLNVEKAEGDMKRVARRMVEENPEVGALLFECTNMPPYTRAVHKEVGLPVFDIVSLTNYVYKSIGGAVG
jgi:Asp/Glu/hydantoin racemase